MGEDTVADLKLALELLLKHQDRILAEGRTGAKYELIGARVVGAITDDPGLLLRLKQV
jgi:hypothetical protein